MVFIAFMDVKTTLKDFKKKIDKEIEIYLDKAIEESAKEDDLIAEALQYVKKMVLAGGKRLRPAFMYYGYMGAGGKEDEKIIKTAVSIELIHAFLLIHDDIIDRDSKRHGIETVNFRYQKIGKNIFPGSDHRHFGDSMGIIIGDMVGALGNQIIFNSGFDAELVMKALDKLQSIVSMTVIGEAQDVYMEYNKKASEKDILKMYENKTAKYTIEGPLHLGAVLGGADDKMLKNLSSYAIPIGIAFQIQDDILGIFGSEEKLGKSVGSDIREGKQTILIVKAKEKADKKQGKILENVFGKNSLTSGDIQDFREIIKDTGSLEYAKNLASRLIAEGKKELEKAEVSPETKNFLLGVADYMVNREL